MRGYAEIEILREGFKWGKKRSALNSQQQGPAPPVDAGFESTRSRGLYQFSTAVLNAIVETFFRCALTLLPFSRRKVSASLVCISQGLAALSYAWITLATPCLRLTRRESCDRNRN